MEWGSLEAFLEMGGYARYVWGAFGVTLVVMAGEIVMLRRRHAQARLQARRLARREGGQ